MISTPWRGPLLSSRSGIFLGSAEDGAYDSAISVARSFPITLISGLVLECLADYAPERVDGFPPEYVFELAGLRNMPLCFSQNEKFDPDFMRDSAPLALNNPRKWARYKNIIRAVKAGGVQDHELPCPMPMSIFSLGEAGKLSRQH